MSKSVFFDTINKKYINHNSLQKIHQKNCNLLQRSLKTLYVARSLNGVCNDKPKKSSGGLLRHTYLRGTTCSGRGRSRSMGFQGDDRTAEIATAASIPDMSKGWTQWSWRWKKRRIFLRVSMSPGHWWCSILLFGTIRFDLIAGLQREDLPSYWLIRQFRTVQVLSIFLPPKWFRILKFGIKPDTAWKERSRNTQN